MSRKRGFRISDESIVETILQMCAAEDVEGQVRPEDVAMELHPADYLARRPPSTTRLWPVM